MRYWPVPSVTTVRVFSMSTELDASTLTPGSTAADGSRTTPAIVAWANTRLGSSRMATPTARTFTTRGICNPPRTLERDAARLRVTFGSADGLEPISQGEDYHTS